MAVAILLSSKTDIPYRYNIQFLGAILLHWIFWEFSSYKLLVGLSWDAIFNLHIGCNFPLIKREY